MHSTVIEDFDAFASDSEYEHSDYERPPSPPTPIKLSSSATDALTKLKHRTPIHIQGVRNFWRDFQDNKHRNPWVDKEGVARDVGALMEIRDIEAKELFDIVHGKQKKWVGRHTHVAADMVEKLKSVSEEYEYQVYSLWSLLDNRRDTRRFVAVQMHGDLGKLMQLEDVEAKEVLRILREMGKNGQLLSPNAKWDRYVRDEPEEGWESYIPVDDTPVVPVTSTPQSSNNKKRPREEYPRGIPGLALDDEPDQDAGVQKWQKIGPGVHFRPYQEDWRCGKCSFWNRVTWGTCHTESCNGSCYEDAVEVHRGVRLA